MPKKLTQHEIRQRAVQTLFAYTTQHSMSETLVKDFQENVKKLEIAITRPPRFDVAFQDDRIIIRDFPKSITTSLKNLSEIYEILSVEDIEKTAVAKALLFIRDFGSHTKKMREEEAIELYQGVFNNLNLVRLFSIEFEEEATAPKVLELLRKIPKNATNEEAHSLFLEVFSRIHESILEKYSSDIFTALTLPDELHKELAKAEQKLQAESEKILENSIDFALNYDNEEAENREVPTYFTTVIDGILSKKSILEATISEHLAKNWSFNRLTLVEQLVLSIGTYEILFTETPDIVATNEAIELAKDFSDEKSSKFINGILTHFIKQD
ncbi:transcription antitermination factor NusB [Lactococcus nasutitermitis]|uniref:Transcription antitermination factor NusB n=1 Tax=Lactococcus nasutitermitis TaxID=1652957 RepID=A0ABV9JAF1_9LACT|nr:transcription antitermination factor NusB [Lactococcus nasutitermitis]